MSDRRICNRCVMPEAPPHIVFDDKGICSLCLQYDKDKQETETRKLLESDFIQLLDKHKGKTKYDVMVMCSGGKDSTSALYYMKTRYKMNTLAFMFDNGFELPEAI